MVLALTKRTELTRCLRDEGVDFIPKTYGLETRLISNLLRTFGLSFKMQLLHLEEVIFLIGRASHAFGYKM
jgi:hypothetical protein